MERVGGLPMSESDQKSDKFATVRAVLNPLRFPEADRIEKAPEEHQSQSDCGAMLRYLCEGVISEPRNLARRYREITSGAPEIVLAPAQPEIVEKIIVPLHGAVTSYMLGSYHGTLALCGLVGEMLAIFIFDIHDIRAGSVPLDAATQGRLFGKSFEKLGQERRIRVLRAFGVIGEALEAKFERLKNLRNKHLHLLSQDTKTLPDDAREAFRLAVELAELVFRVEFDDGKAKLRPQLMRYLDAHKMLDHPSS